MNRLRGIVVLWQMLLQDTLHHICKQKGEISVF